jgi:hypothetical protein
MARPSDWLIALLAIAVIVLGIGLALTLFGDEPADPLAIGVTLDDVTAHPDEFVEERVIVSGDVDEVLAPHVFTLGPERVLVVSQQAVTRPDGGLPADAVEESIAQVEGRVMRFDRARLEREAGIRLDPALMEDDEDRLVIVARSVLLNPSVEQAAEAHGEEVGGAQGPGGLLGPGVMSVMEALGRAEHLEGRHVTVAGEVGQAIAPHVAVLLGELDRERNLVLVRTDPLVAAFPEQIPARVSGTLRPFETAALERELGIDLDEALLGEFEGETALVVESIEYVFSFRSTSRSLLNLLGERVFVRSSIHEVLGPTAFTIDDGRVMVLSREAPDKDDGPIRRATAVVRGTAGAFRIDEAERIAGVELDPLLDPDEWEGKPVIIAESVTIIR